MPTQEDLTIDEHLDGKSGKKQTDGEIRQMLEQFVKQAAKFGGPQPGQLDPTGLGLTSPQSLAARIGQAPQQVATPRPAPGPAGQAQQNLLVPPPAQAMPQAPGQIPRSESVSMGRPGQMDFATAKGAKSAGIYDDFQAITGLVDKFGKQQYEKQAKEAEQVFLNYKTLVDSGQNELAYALFDPSTSQGKKNLKLAEKIKGSIPGELDPEIAGFQNAWKKSQQQKDEAAKKQQYSQWAEGEKQKSLARMQQIRQGQQGTATQSMQSGLSMDQSKQDIQTNAAKQLEAQATADKQKEIQVTGEQQRKTQEAAPIVTSDDQSVSTLGPAGTLKTIKQGKPKVDVKIVDRQPVGITHNGTEVPEKDWDENDKALFKRAGEIYQKSLKDQETRDRRLADYSADRQANAFGQQDKTKAEQEKFRLDAEVRAKDWNPVMETDFRRYSTMDKLAPKARDGDPQAALNILYSHIGMTNAATGSKYRPNRAQIEEAVHARGLDQDIVNWWDRLVTGKPITSKQVDQMLDNAKEGLHQGANEAFIKARIAGVLGAPKELVPYLDNAATKQEVAKYAQQNKMSLTAAKQKFEDQNITVLEKVW